MHLNYIFKNTLGKLCFVLVLISSNVSITQETKDSVSIYFDFNAEFPRLDSANQRQFERLKKLDTSSKLTIFGFTDTIGTTRHNNALAMNRARSVKKILGDSFNDMEIQSVGESSLLPDIGMNRRVLIVYSENRSTIQPQFTTRDTLNLNLSFVGDSAILLAESYPVIQELCEFLDGSTYSEIQLLGHVCCSPEYQLSLDRARAVKAMLLVCGVDENKIKCFGHSNEKPLVPENSPKNQQKNRRVEIIIFP